MRRSCLLVMVCERRVRFYSVYSELLTTTDTASLCVFDEEERGFSAEKCGGIMGTLPFYSNWGEAQLM